MGIFDRFPYSSTHEMNLDFMLGKATEIAESLQTVQDGLSDIDTHKAQAEQAAQDAAQAKQAAQSAAQTASTSAGQAAQHKTDAEDAADRAEAASNLADDAVEQAQTAAQNASTAADGAIASATAAENRINAAAAQAQTDVQAAATQAQTNVQTAADSAVASAAAAENRINALAESLPEDLTELNNGVTDLRSALISTVRANTLNINDYEKGGIDGQGQNSTYRQAARARTKTIKKADYDFEITAQPDQYASWFMYIYFFDNEGTVIGNSGGWVKKITIPANSNYRITLTIDVNSTEEKSLDEILTHYNYYVLYDNIRTTTGISKELHNIAFKGITIFPSNLVESGSITNGANDTFRENSRCRTIDILKYDYDVTIKSINSQFEMFVVYYDENDTFIENGPFLAEITIPSGTKFRIVFLEKDNNNITSEYILKNFIVYTLPKETAEKVEVISNRTEEYTAFINKCQKGSITVDTSTGWTNTTYKQNARISINADTPLALKAGTIISFPYGYKMFLSYRANGAYYQYDWFVADYICTIDADYVFTFGKYDDTDFVNMSVKDIAKLINIIPYYNNAINRNIKEITFTPHGKIKSVARLGYNISNTGTPPENSIASYEAALEHGYDIMLADVRWTSDHVPVAIHDVAINTVARNSDGTALSETVNINSITLSEADTYDFGIIKGTQYAGTKIMRIVDFIEWCVKKGVTAFLEIKTDGLSVTQDDFDALYAVMDKYNIGNNAILLIDNDTLRTAMHSRYPHATISLSFSDGSNIATVFGKASEVKDNNEVFVYVYAKESFSYMITKALVDAAVEYNIKLGLTDCKNETNFETFLESDYGLAVDYLAIRDMPFYTYIRKKEKVD